MKHKWEMYGDVGMYDTTYRCHYCRKLHTKSADRPKSAPPEEGCPATPERIRAEYEILDAEFQEAAKRRLDLQKLCKHPNVVKKHGANTGNWCPQDDCYWTDFNCPDCKKHWTEEGSK